MPLLYFCAEELLAGSSNSTTFNERLHSPAGYIYNKLRARLKPDNVEKLTLTQYFLRKQLLASLDKDKEEQERKAAIFEHKEAEKAAAAAAAAARGDAGAAARAGAGADAEEMGDDEEEDGEEEEEEE